MKEPNSESGPIMPIPAIDVSGVGLCEMWFPAGGGTRVVCPPLGGGAEFVRVASVGENPTLSLKPGFSLRFPPFSRAFL